MADMLSLVYVDVNDKQEGKEDKEEKDDKESFLSQVHEKLCSSDFCLLVSSCLTCCVMNETICQM